MGISALDSGAISIHQKERDIMPNDFLSEIGGRGVGVLFGMLLGGTSTAIVAHLRRRRERRSILEGDARDTVVIAHHIIGTETVPGENGAPERVVPRTLRIRALGQSQLDRVVPNGYLASILLKRTLDVSTKNTLISMVGAEGSYLLESLTNFVCDRVGNGPFAHDLYVMAPCCEPEDFAQHQPITIILIRVADLALFADWTVCREIEVERSGEGARVLTLRELAQRFRDEQARIAELRRAGQRTRFVETSYVLDLALDRQTAPIPTKGIPWGRFEPVLKELNLE